MRVDAAVCDAVSDCARFGTKQTRQSTNTRIEKGQLVRAKEAKEQKKNAMEMTFADVFLSVHERETSPTFEMLVGPSYPEI